MKLINVILIACIVCASSAFAETSNYNFPQNLFFNKQTWKLDHQAQSPRTILAEYVAGGESSKHWTQLFTYQQMVKSLPDTVTPRDFAEHIEANLKQRDIHYNFQILSYSDDEALLEFKVTEPTELQQDEIQRVIKAKNGIFVVMHYVIRKLDMGTAMRKAWIANLKNMPMIII